MYASPLLYLTSQECCCGSAIASRSYTIEWVKGKTIEQALKLKNTEIVKELSFPPVKLQCSMLSE